LLLTETETKKPRAGQIQVFEYMGSAEEEPVQLWEGLVAPPEEKAPEVEPVVPQINPDQIRRGVEQQMRTDFERRLNDETKRAFEQGREKGKQEGQQAEREAQAASNAAAEEHRNRQIAEIAARFTVERDRYLHLVEHEVVLLALAVAARILRREAQMDPLLLTGAVRVALGQLASSTRVRLQVPACDLPMWKQAISMMPKLAVKPEVVAGEGMRTGDCVIETDLGTVDLGIRSQLGEIEHGFFDRAGRRETPGEPVEGLPVPPEVEEQP
jgi:flagellar assembly protein FliH